MPATQLNGYYMCLPDSVTRKQSYEFLASAIVAQAVSDFLKTGNEIEFKSFLFSDWFSLLCSINPETIFEHCKKIR